MFVNDKPQHQLWRGCNSTRFTYKKQLNHQIETNFNKNNTQKKKTKKKHSRYTVTIIEYYKLE